MYFSPFLDNLIMREFVRSAFLGPTIWYGYRDLENRRNTSRIRTSHFRITSARLPCFLSDMYIVCLYILLCLHQVIVLPMRICLTYPSSPYVSPPVIFVVEDPYIDGFASLSTSAHVGTVRVGRPQLCRRPSVLAMGGTADSEPAGIL
jgi:hypothetical protein